MEQPGVAHCAPNQARQLSWQLRAQPSSWVLNCAIVLVPRRWLHNRESRHRFGVSLCRNDIRQPVRVLLIDAPNPEVAYCRCATAPCGVGQGPVDGNGKRGRMLCSGKGGYVQSVGITMSRKRKISGGTLPGTRVFVFACCVGTTACRPEVVAGWSHSM